MRTDEELCPGCGTNLQGEPIPQEAQADYGCTHFSRVIGVEYPEIYDGIHHWLCPDCGHTWGGYGALKKG